MMSITQSKQSLHLWSPSWLALLLAFQLASLLAIDQAESANKFKPDTESKNNLRVLLTKMNVRHVPLAKELSENYLAQLYRSERRLREDIEGLQKNLVLDDNSPFAEANVELVQSSLEDKNHQLLEVQTRIQAVKRVIKDPQNSIMVPTNYGRNPAGQRELEREQLMRDRENSNYRSDVLEGRMEPSWLVDEW